MNSKVFLRPALKRRLIPLIWAVSALMLLPGCINYEQKTTLNEDGSGTAQIHYWAAEDVVTFLTDGPLVFDEAKVKERFSGKGITVKNVKIEMNEEDSTRHVHVDIDFGHIHELAKTKAFEDVDITWEPADDMMKFTQTVKSGENGGSLGMDEFTLTYTYEMPGEIVSSNATDHDGNTLTWKYKLSELSGDGITMSATVKKGGVFGNIAVTGAIILGVLVLIVIIFIAVRKKSAGMTAAQYSATPEAPPVYDSHVETPADIGETPEDEEDEKPNPDKTE